MGKVHKPSDSEGNIIFHPITGIQIFKAVLVLNEAITYIRSVVSNPCFAAVFTATECTEAYKYYQR
jgi:hypothetical protein